MNATDTKTISEALAKGVLYHAQGTIKATLKQLDSQEIRAVGKLTEHYQVQIKRSGPGITVIFK